MKRLLLLGLVVLGICLPRLGYAGVPYTIQWAMLQMNPKCEHAHLIPNGDAFFHANGIPLPTYEVPGAFTENADGTETNLAETGFDSILLRLGDNKFSFGVKNTSGDDTCVLAHNIVLLQAPQIGLEKLLFDVWREGTAYSGDSTIAFALAEINPPLAQDIAILNAELASERKWLVEHAKEIADLALQQDMLQQLETELQDLVKRPLDEVSQVDLDAILDRYSPYIDDATRQALKQVLDDLKKSVADLQQELSSLIDVFGAQADDAVDLATGKAREAGFNPDDPANYGILPDEASWVEVPDVSGIPGAFEPGNDPYAAYADSVIAILKSYVVNGKVASRMSFLANVKAWRANQKALEAALLARTTVSQAETSAFLNAQNKVASYVGQFLDAADWFFDSPVPADVRAQIDGALKQAFAEMAEELKEALNAWGGGFTLDLEHTMLFEQIRALSGAVSEGVEMVQPFIETMASITHAATRIGLNFVPVVGPVLDFCEVVTGREWCLPNGRQLSDGELVFAMVGIGGPKIIGAAKGIRGSAVNAATKRAAGTVLSLGEEVALLLRKNRIAKWNNGMLDTKGVEVAEEFINELEIKAAIHLMKTQKNKMLGVGDKAVRLVLEIEANAIKKGVSIAPDFISVSPSNLLVLSESKGGLNKINVKKAADQLNNAMKKLVEKGLAGFVERVQIFIPKGTTLKDGFDLTVDNKLIGKAGELVKVTGRPDLAILVIRL